MFDSQKLQKIASGLLSDIGAADEALSSLITYENVLGHNLGVYFSCPDHPEAVQEITDLVKSTAANAKACRKSLQRTINSVEKLTVYLRYPHLNYYWV